MSWQGNKSQRDRPRTFTPPPVRPVRRRRTRPNWPHPSWQAGLVAALVRAFCAVAFAGFGAFEERFDDAALTVLSIGLAVFVFAIVYVAVKMQSAITVGILLPDAIGLLNVPAMLWIASGIKVADPQFGGGAGNFVLAVLAVLAMFSIVAVVSTVVNWGDPLRAGLGALGAGFAIVAIFSSGERFAAGALTDGMSLAFMVAGVVTLLDGFVMPRARALLRTITIGGFVAIMVIAGLVGGRSAAMSGTNTVIALLATFLVAGMLLALPGFAQTIRSESLRTPELPGQEQRVEPIRYPGTSLPR